MARQDPHAKLFARLHPTSEELAKVKAAEKSGDAKRLIDELGALDRKYKARSIDSLGVDKKIISTEASRESAAGTLTLEALPASSLGLLAGLKLSNDLSCDCVVPFQFQRLDVYTNMSGPEQGGVARGVLGANRYTANEYTVWNPGDTDGKTRVHIVGQMHISFGAQLPQSGRWCLIHPSGSLLIRGHSRVVGHGNMTTSYDAKVWVDYYQVLEVGGTLVELSGGGIHYDGTRSEDRTKYFNSDRYLPPRYVFFNAPHANDYINLTLRIEVDTAANEDGLATGVVDLFGFFANGTHDFDTFVVKA